MIQFNQEEMDLEYWERNFKSILDEDDDIENEFEIGEE